MSKTTFLGYVPSLKSKHEATIVGHKAIKSKGGSIRYTLQGEYDGRKTLPKTVSKADFESVYGFDAKEAEAAIIYGEKEGKPVGYIHVVGHEDKRGVTPTEIHTGTSGISPEEMVEAINRKGAKAADTVGNPSPASVEPPAPSEKPFPQEPSNENFSADYYCTKCDEGFDSITPTDEGQFCNSCLPDSATAHDDMDATTQREDFNAFGFGKKDEEEESEEPKTQEFTVVLQEGDKLELTDIEEEEEQEDTAAPDEPKEEDSPEESENEEKEADEDMVERTFFITDAWYDTYDETDEDSFEDQYGYNQSEEQPKFEDEDLTLTIDAYPQDGYGEISDSLVDALSNSTGFGVYHFSFVEIMPDGSKKVLEAVQAKVTRPVKEDETEEDEESEEGLSTGAKVALGVGALAAGVALFGAEEYPQEFLDEFYDFDSNPTADTQDEETLAIAYAAWKHSKENRLYESETNYSRIYEATSGDGYISHNRIDTEEKRMVELRHDQPVSYYNWNSPYDVDESDVKDEVRNELGDKPGEGAYGATVEVLGSKFGENGQKYVEVDVDMNTDYGDSRFMGLAAEGSLSHRVFYSVVNTDTGDEIDYGQMVVEAPSMKEALEKAQIMLDKNAYEGEEYEVYPNGMRVQAESFGADKEKNIYKKILKQKAEGVHISGIKDDKRESRLHIVGYEDDDGFTPKEISDFDTNNLTPYETNLSKRLSKNHGAESFEAEKMGWDIKEYGNKEKYASKNGVEVIIAPIRKSSYQYHPRDAKWKLTYGRETPHGVVPLAKLFGTYGEVFRWLNNPPFEVKSFGADTIGNPSPSGPSSTPEPAEATGSEPSNENMEAEGSNMKMALGILGVGVGAVALLGGDRIKKIFDKLGL